MHGINPGFSCTMRNVEVWGWHYNNDGFRPWGGLVEHCFRLSQRIEPGNRPEIGFDTLFDADYQVLYSTDLENRTPYPQDYVGTGSPVWIPLRSVLPDTNQAYFCRAVASE